MQQKAATWDQMRRYLYDQLKLLFLKNLIRLVFRVAPKVAYAPGYAL